MNQQEVPPKTPPSPDNVKTYSPGEKRFREYSLEKVSDCIKQRFTLPGSAVLDSTPHGFPQPRENYKEVRPGASTVSQVGFEGQPPKTLQEIVAEYNEYSVFRFKLKEEHTLKGEGFLEGAIQTVSHAAAQSRGMCKIVDEEFSLTAFNYARQRIVQLMEEVGDSGGDYAQNVSTRPDWALEVTRPADIYFLIWLLHIEGQKHFDAQTLNDVDTKGKFLAVFNNSDIDLVEAALIEALIYYHGRDPVFETN